MSLEASSVEREVFPYWIGRGLHAFPVESPFIDIGLPESYAAAAGFFMERGYA
jgi:NDP-sugar pyrophosphorylase family protein